MLKFNISVTSYGAPFKGDVFSLFEVVNFYFVMNLRSYLSKIRPPIRDFL